MTLSNACCYMKTLSDTCIGASQRRFVCEVDSKLANLYEIALGET